MVVPEANYFVHTLLRARDWQHRPEFDQVCEWWRVGGRGVCALVGMGGAGKTAIADRFLDAVQDAGDTLLPQPQTVFAYSFYNDDKPESFFRHLQIWLEGTSTPGKQKSPTQLMFDIQQHRGLVVLDGLEKVQESGARGGFGRLTSPSLRDLLNHIAYGAVRELSVLVTSRFPLTDLRDSQPRFFHTIAVDQIDVSAGIALLRDRGVRGTDVQLAPIVEHCGRHALTIDLAGGYIKEYGHADPSTLLNLGMAEELQAEAEQEPDDEKRAVLKQGIRFSRIAQRYREAMLKSDEAALALLERICLFRMGVDCETLTAIFTGAAAEEVSGTALAGLDANRLQKKLDWLVRMRIVEPSGSSSPRAERREPTTLYTIHPAVRDGFLSGIARETAAASHVAVRKRLEVSLGSASGESPSDPATLDILEEIVFHAIGGGYVEEGWNIYMQRMGGYENLGRRLGAFERGLRVCNVFAGSRGPEALAERLPQGRRRWFLDGQSRHIPALLLGEAAVNDLLRDWGYYALHAGNLELLRICLESSIHWSRTRRDYPRAAWCSLDLAGILAIRGSLSQAAKIVNDELVRCYSGTEYYQTRNGEVASSQGRVLDSLGVFEDSHDAQLRLREDLEEQLESLQMQLKRHKIGSWSRRHRERQVAELKAWQAGRHPGARYPNYWSDVWGYYGVGHWQGEKSPGIHHLASILSRIGRFAQVVDYVGSEKDRIIEQLGEDNEVLPKLNLVWTEPLLENGDTRRATDLTLAAHNWGRTRDAKEVLCWSKLMQARIELFAITRQQSTEEDWKHHCAAACTAVESGLKIARDCGFGIFHIDLLLERAQLHLVQGKADAALDDIEVALDAGVPANEETGQVKLLAANQEECGYAWAIPAGLQLRAEALLLRTAHMLLQDSYVPAKRSEVPADVAHSLDQAKQHLHEALDRWHDLRDPEPTEGNNFVHPETGREYNYRAEQTYQVLVELEGGMVTRYPLKSTSADDELDQNPVEPHREHAKTQRMPTFDTFLSHNSKDKPDVKRLGEALRERGMTVWLDEWELQPGLSCQDAMEDIITNCKSAAVCVGRNGVGPWEEPEMKALLRRYVNEKRAGLMLSIIPVLLPGAPDDVTLPLFLAEFNWVDLRLGLSKEGLDKLEWGITGVNPNV